MKTGRIAIQSPSTSGFGFRVFRNGNVLVERIIYLGAKPRTMDGVLYYARGAILVLVLTGGFILTLIGTGRCGLSSLARPCNTHSSDRFAFTGSAFCLGKTQGGMAMNYKKSQAAIPLSSI
jgi:hypothetical protein